MTHSMSLFSLYACMYKHTYIYFSAEEKYTKVNRLSMGSKIRGHFYFFFTHFFAFHRF